MVCQFCWENRLFIAEIVAARRRETTRPATTAATRPEPPRCSAGIDAMKGIAKEKTVSAEGSLMRARRRTPTSPTTHPMPAAIPRAMATLPMSKPGLRACSSAARPALIAAESRTSEVASLKSPSPSSTVMMRWETPERFAFETATASVGDRTAPRATPQGREIAGTSQLMTKPTAKAERNTRGIASIATACISRRKSMVGIRTAAENSSGGSTISRMMCGSISMAPTCGRNPIARPTTSRIRGGCHAHLRGDELACHDDEHSGHGDKKGFHRSIVLRATPAASLPSHRINYARRELARRTTPRPHGLDTIPECQTDPHDQSTLYNRRIVSRRFA